MEVKTDADEKIKPWWPPGTKCQCKKTTRYVQPQRVKSLKPILEYKTPTAPLSGDTIYKKSYKTFDSNDIAKCKNEVTHPKDSLCSAGDFSSDTTNKMSYCPWEGYTKPEKIEPRDHCLIGAGPLQDMTTMKHDYTPKVTERPPKVEPPGCIGMSTKPMEQHTTNLLSYGWPDNIEPLSSYKPQSRYEAPTNKMEKQTIQKLSFQPWKNVQKPDVPWAAKPKYVEPSVPMIGETIYNNSFFAPGKFVDDPSCEGCYCLNVGECFNKEGNPPKAHEFSVCPPGYNPLTDGPREPS